MSGLTEDGFLDGRIRVRQFTRGFRSGLDAVILAAAVPVSRGSTILEIGAGAGVASLCLAVRVPDCMVTGVEIDSDLATLANENATANGMASRVHFENADVLDLPRELRTSFDHVMCNPPFHDESGDKSPDQSREQALRDSGDLARWIEVGAKRTASNGTFTIILRADRLNHALTVLPDSGIRIFPLWPKRDAAAKRVLIQLRRGSRSPLTLSHGLILHQDNGCYTPEADAILREGASLPLGTP